MTQRLTTIGGQTVTSVHNAHRVTTLGVQVIFSRKPRIPDPPSPAAIAFRTARGGSVYLDSYLEYDGRHAGASDGLFPGSYMTLSGGSTWAAGEELTLTSNQSVFTTDDVGNVIILHAEDDADQLRLTIVARTNGFTVTVTPNVAVPTAMRGAPVVTWDRAVDVVAGLEHLEGKTVGIFADEHVVGSPFNARIQVRTVVDGQVSLDDDGTPNAYAHVLVGLPYLADLETLDIDNAAGPTLKATRMNVTKVGLHVLKSRAVWVGNKRPSDDFTDPLEDLEEMPKPTEPDYESLRDEYEDVNVKGRWNSNGRVFVRSVDPTPSTVLAAIPQGHLPPAGSV